MSAKFFFALILSLAGASAFADSKTPLEFKILVDTSTNVHDVLKTLKFNHATAKRSDLYYYDTKDLRLFSAGLLIRSQDVLIGKDVVVVKARPLERADLDSSWFEVPGLDCEVDASPLRSTSGCSIHSYIVETKLSAVVNRRKGIQYLLTADQEFFANDFGGLENVRTAVVPLGPIAVWRWRSATQDGWPIDAEYWRLPNGGEFIELSIQGRVADHVNLDLALRTFMKERGLPFASFKINKTLIALQLLSTRAAPAVRRAHVTN